MLLRTSSLKNLSIAARDGEIGNINDLLFEDDTWRARWLVVSTGSWLFGRKVLLPASHVAPSKPGATSIVVDLTKEQVESSPGSGVDLPVSRQMETSIYESYGWTPYWAAHGMAYASTTAFPVFPVAPIPAAPGAPAVGPVPVDGTHGGSRGHEQPSGDPHLRSAKEVTGYYVRAADGDIGHVEDLLVDGSNWLIRYLIVDTKNWWSGKMVLVTTEWIDDISWTDETVQTSQARDEIKRAPEYNPALPIDRISGSPA
ncbi:PRC-barrel domain-containing protein [Microvirga arabica]|uniref:PRC-barrel domain-containing protein n=3 Tax=Microvirga arabica TaxID=1128671 RepID=UPI00193A6CE6|nr:PRC-barrel domain-containing protein [Microvirga arabica]MBM1170032.1 PRC-barrel domain-containing protein [Microvirga arabica]